MNHRLTAAQFWSRVAKAGDGDCWEWQARRDKDGYGRVSYAGKIRGAHRMAWQFSFGDIPLGMCVLHECDNPPCCNPAHLFLGTNVENVADKVAKGRQAQLSDGRENYWLANSKKGERNGSSKLSDGDVRRARELRESGMTYTALAKELGVTERTVWLIVNGKAWTHVA